MSDPAGTTGTTGAVTRPPTVTLAVVLLLIYATVLLVGGSRLVVTYWDAEELAAVAAIAGLIFSVIGLGHVVLAVPASLGGNGARLTLAVITVPLVAYEVLVGWATSLAGSYGPGLTVLVLGLVALPPAAVVLLYLPPSRPFFRRRRRTR